MDEPESISNIRGLVKVSFDKGELTKPTVRQSRRLVIVKKVRVNRFILYFVFLKSVPYSSNFAIIIIYFHSAYSLSTPSFPRVLYSPLFSH